MRLYIERKEYTTGSERAPSRIVDGPYLVTWDTAARRLIDLALDVPVRINLDGANQIEDVSLTIFSKSIESDFMSDFYDFRNVRIYGHADDLMFSGKITESAFDLSRGTIRLVCRSTLSRQMSAPFTYSSLSQNPVEAVKVILENAGATVDAASYTRVLALLEADTVRAAFSYHPADSIGSFEAVSRICELFGFFVYQEAGTFYFWSYDSFRNEIPLSDNDVGNLKFEHETAKYTQLSVTWELGSTVEVLTSPWTLYGVIDHALDLCRPANIVAFNVGTIRNGIARMFSYRNNRRRFVSFVSPKNLDLRERYSLNRETVSIVFQIIEKTLMPSGLYSYRALLTGTSW